MNKLPTEQIERSKSELLVDGRKVGAWTIGNTGLNFVKYIWMHKFCSSQHQKNHRKIS